MGPAPASGAEPSSEWRVRRPAGPVALVAERYVGYRMTGFPAGLHRGLPSPHMTFIVSIGPRIDVVRHTDPAQSPGSYGAVLGGLQAAHALIAHDGDQEGIAIELTPLGSRALCGAPAGALWNTSVELDEVVGPAGAELWERLQGTDGWDERFAVCDAVLSRLVAERRLAPELTHAWQLLVASGGRLPVGALAAEVGWSRQHLTRRFTAEFGTGPKVAARIVRFDRAKRALTESTAGSIAQVAARCGYFDQAHLTNEFIDLAGCSPRRLLAEEALPSFQDGDADERRGSVP